MLSQSTWAVTFDITLAQFLCRSTYGKRLDSGYYACSHMWTAPALQDAGQCFDPIACVHMSGLLMRSPMSAGQDGFRDESSKQ